MSGYLVQGMRDCQDVFQYVSPDVEDEEVGSELLLKLSLDHEKTEEVLASCRKSGLLLLRRRILDEDEHKHGKCKYIYSVCKPGSGQSQQLPSPAPRPDSHPQPWEIVSASVLVQQQTKSRYKIVLLWTPERGNSYKTRVFDSEAWAWSDGKEEYYLPIGSGELIIRPSSPVVTTAANSIFWLTTQDNVVELCGASNSFGKKFPLPAAVLRNGRHKRLVEYRGGLGLVCVREGDGCSELWLKSDETNNNAWRKEMEVQGAEEYTHPVGFCSPEMALFESANEVLFYKVGGGGGCSLIRKVPTRWCGMPLQVFPFVSDSEPVRLGPPAS